MTSDTADTPASRISELIPRAFVDPVGGPYAAFAVRISAGSRHDPDGASGTAHLVEHLVMRSEPSSGREPYATYLARVGAEHTIVTTREVIELAAVMPSDRLEEVVYATMDVLMDPRSVDQPGAVNIERAVIQDEIMRHSSDRRDSTLLQVAIRYLVSAEPSFWMSPLGCEEDIGKIEGAEARAFVRAHLHLSTSRWSVLTAEKTLWQALDSSDEGQTDSQSWPTSMICAEELDGRGMLAFRIPRVSDLAHDKCASALRFIAAQLPGELRTRLSIVPFENQASVAVLLYSGPVSSGAVRYEVTPEDLLGVLDDVSTEFLRAAAARSRFRALQQGNDLRERAKRLVRGQTPTVPLRGGNIRDLDRKDLLRDLGVDALAPWLRTNGPAGGRSAAS
ncbi:MAG: insulinase family protein [Micrococcaceae bacterium]